MPENTHQRNGAAGPKQYPALYSLAGIIAALFGATWCMARHARRDQGAGRRRRMRATSSGGHWIRKGVMAGLAGVMVGVLRQPPEKDRDGTRRNEVRLTSHITVNCAPREAYDYWRDFRQLPRVMRFLERVEPLSENRYRWVLRGPVGASVSWEAEVVDDRPGEILAWRSLEGYDIDHWGHVAFRPRGENRGTELAVELNVTTSGPATRAVVRRLAGLENAALDQALRDIKAYLEAGEITTARRYTHPSGKGA